MRIGSKLKTIRKANKISLKILSSMTGISISFLSDIENDRSNPSIEKLKLIAKALDTPVSYFLDDPINNDDIFEDTELLPILDLIKDFKEWNHDDKNELLYYLKAKKVIRDSNKTL